MSKILNSYIKTITYINKKLYSLTILLVFIMVPAMMTDIISRYVFNNPTIWGMELAVLLFGPYFLLGGPYLLHLGGHVNLDLVRVRMPETLGHIIDILNQIIIIFFCVALFIYAYPLVLQAIEYRETTFSAWNPPLWPYKITVPVALLLLGLQSIAELILIITKKNKEDLQ